jgi:hypothetical protein
MAEPSQEVIMAKSKSKLKYPDRKISDTLLQFAEPLLDARGSNLTEAQMEEPLVIAWTVWNAVIYADVGEDRYLLDQLRASTAHDPHLKGLIELAADR